MNELKMNLKAASNELTLDEKELLDALYEKYFKGLPMNNWENGYVEDYWSKMDKQSFKQPTDIL